MLALGWITLLDQISGVPGEADEGGIGGAGEAGEGGAPRVIEGEGTPERSERSER